MTAIKERPIELDIFSAASFGGNMDYLLKAFPCPYGKIGDILYVKETSMPFDRFILDHENEPPKYIAYRADDSVYNITEKTDFKPSQFNGIKWKPSLFMPKSAARIRRKITGYKIEKLNDISEEDAIAEGIEPLFMPHEINDERGYHYEFDLNPMPFKNYLWPKKADYSSCYFAKLSYFSLWDFINGVDDSRRNPWVWAVSFDII